MVRRLAVSIVALAMLVMVMGPSLGQSRAAQSLEGAYKTVPAMPRADASSGIDPWGRFLI
jgi:hypothetical protein